LKYDYYGKRIATCSSDQTIKIWDVVEGSYRNSYTWKAHNGSIWKVEWSHPSFGQLIASCSSDRTGLKKLKKF
jgi:nucleoporin SEH1